jgi:hypothetical protein
MILSSWISKAVKGNDGLLLTTIARIRSQQIRKNLSNGKSPGIYLISDLQKTYQESNYLNDNVILRFDCWPRPIIQVVRSQYTDTRIEYVQFSGCQQGAMTLDDEITTRFRRAWAGNIHCQSAILRKNGAVNILVFVTVNVDCTSICRWWDHSLLCCSGYQRYPAGFIFSEGRTFRHTLTQPSGCHGDNSKNIYFQGKTISFFFVTCCKLTSCKVTLMWGVSWSITTNVRG